MRMAEIIRDKLTVELAPERLEIVDESAQHAGHVGARAGGETHFRLTVVADGFSGLSRVERQRRVYAILAAEMRDRIHALSVSALTPDEAWRST